jgi:hypothetical protein
MKHAFNIYPALLVLTPVRLDETVGLTTQFKDSEGTLESERYFTSYPQTYWGNCIVHEDQTQLIFGSKKEKSNYPKLNLSNGRKNFLEPAKFKGKNYTITYIPVLN